MSSSIYQINKGINKPIEFKGIKAQYIMYLAVGLVFLLLLFIISYVAGVPIYLCLAADGILGYTLFAWVIKYSHKYGEYGLLKEAGYRQVPSTIKCKSRRTFLTLSKT